MWTNLKPRHARLLQPFSQAKVSTHFSHTTGAILAELDKEHLQEADKAHQQPTVDLVNSCR